VTATPGVTGTYWNVALVGGEYPGGVLTDTDDAPVAIVDPAIALDKQLVAFDTDLLAPNYVTFTIVITNVGISTIDVLPLLDAYDPYYLSFVWAEPMPRGGRRRRPADLVRPDRAGAVWFRAQPGAGRIVPHHHRLPRGARHHHDGQHRYR